MDDEDDRRLLDFIGDVQALNDYLHGSNSKSIEDDDLTNATFESSSSFFTSDVVGSEEGLKDVHNHLDDFGEDSGTGLHLSNSLQFIEDDLDGSISPGGDDLVGEDQPFDILQKSLLEADITEKTLAQEALLDTQPTLVSPNTNFSQQLVSGGLGSLSGTGVVAPVPLAGAEPQAFIQQVSQLPLSNGPAGQIQLVGSLNGSTHSMMTINSLDQPHILIRPGGNAVATNNGQGTTFTTSTPGQVSVPFNKGAIQLQNIIIQRGPVPQTLIRPIQPKAFQTGGQAVYNISNLGIQPNTTTVTNVASNVYPANGSPQTSQHMKVVGQATSIVVHSPLGQQGQQQAHSSLPQGQFLIPASSTVHGLQGVNGQVLQNNAQVSNPPLTSTTAYSILTNQNTAMQIIAGQNFAAGGQLIVNQGMVNAGQIGQASPTGVMQVPQRLGVTTKVWTATTSTTPNCVQTLQPPNALTMVNSTPQPLPTHLQISVSPGQRLLVPVAQNTSSSSNIGVQDLQQQVLLNQKDSTLPNQKGQTQLLNLLGIKASSNSESLRRPANHQLSREGMILEQLRYDHSSITAPDRTSFTSLNDIIDRLLPYHVFQGAPPYEEDFDKVDEEFETVASQVLQKTQSMVNKYRRLLMVEAERCSPSSETVMIDRTFNQEERNSLTQDRRLLMTDPDGFLEEFCCGPKKRTLNSGVRVSSEYKGVPGLMETSSSHDMQTGEEGERTVEFLQPACRTETHPASEDPGGGKHGDTSIKISIDMKKIRSKYVTSSSNNTQHRQHFNSASYATSPSHSQHSSEQLNPSEHIQSSDRNHGPLADTDSVLEAAVNSILDC